MASLDYKIGGLTQKQFNQDLPIKQMKRGTISEVYICTNNVLLASISSVQESTTEQNLQAEQAILPDLFAFGYSN